MVPANFKGNAKENIRIKTNETRHKKKGTRHKLPE